MKSTSQIWGVAVTLAFSSIVPIHSAVAQEMVTQSQSTTVSGSIQQFSPDALTVTTTSSGPASYRISKTTRYVDDDGNPVSVEVVRSGAPVTVYYEADGDQSIASRVVVHKVSTTTDGNVATTVTSDEPTTVAGTVTQFGDGIVSVRTTAEAPATQYYFSKTTKYVDTDGNPVSVSYVKSGVPVTVQYAKIGDRMVASKVIVKRTHRETTTQTGGAVEQTSSSAVVSEPAPAPVVHKKTTTTTTTQGND